MSLKNNFVIKPVMFSGDLNKNLVSVEPQTGTVQFVFLFIPLVPYKNDIQFACTHIPPLSLYQRDTRQACIYISSPLMKVWMVYPTLTVRFCRWFGNLPMRPPSAVLTSYTLSCLLHNTTRWHNLQKVTTCCCFCFAQVSDSIMLVYTAREPSTKLCTLCWVVQCSYLPFHNYLVS